MTGDNPTPLQVSIDPIKYLNKLPTYNGNRDDLHIFISLVDRIYPLLTRYDETSQQIFSDILKSRLVGKAKEIIEIHNNIVTWNDIKNLFIHCFGDRLSVEQLFDELRSLTFKTNCFDFYNEIKTILRRLNNKTKVNQGTVTELKNNCKMALKIFMNKIPEPMKSVLYCRNPLDLEEAMQILFEANYAFTRVNYKINNKNYNNNHITGNTNSNSFKNNPQNNDYYRNNRGNNNHKNNRNNNNNYRYSGYHNPSYQKSGTFNYQNNSNRHNQNRHDNTNNDRNNTSEPMDVDESTTNRRTYNIEKNRTGHLTESQNENFRLTASTNQLTLAFAILNG